MAVTVSRIRTEADGILIRLRERGVKSHSHPDVLGLLTQQVKDIVDGRPSTRVSKLHEYFLKYTDRWCRAPGEELWQELSTVNHYLQVHLLYHKHKNYPIDNTPLLFYHAGVPQILLEMIHQSLLNPDFFLGSPKTRCLPFLTVEILTCLMHQTSDTFLLLPAKLFDDAKSRLDSLYDILTGKLTWFDRLGVLHFYGVASFSPPGVHWLFSNIDTFQEVCTYMYRASDIAEDHIRRGEVDWRHEDLSCQIRAFRSDSDLQLSARILGLMSTGQAVFVFLNVLRYSRSHYINFRTVATAVRKASVLDHFATIVKKLMAWTDPTHFLNPFLNGVCLCMDMLNGPEDLFVDNIVSCKERKTSVGIESLKYWRSENKLPTHLGWFLAHSLCLDDMYGSGWCIHILCLLLKNASGTVVTTLVENCGNELMDLAHLVEISYPEEKTRVQAVILEALLRHGGITHKEVTCDMFEGTLKEPSELADYSLEAALFSKKAMCEDALDLITKQSRVWEADNLKDEGNQHFKAGRYKEAIMRYTDAIGICPLSARTKQAIYYSNRAECYLRSHEPKRAVHDCNRSLCLDRSAKVKVQWQRSRAYQKLNLEYPAWLDMKCLEDHWCMSKAESGIDFDELLQSLSNKVGIIKNTLRQDMKMQNWTTWLLPDKFKN